MTDSQIVPFLFEGEQMIRVITRDEAPWFMASDVCRAIDIGNPTMAVAPLDGDEKGTLSSAEGGPDRIIISEGGLYTIILRSRGATKPGTPAHRFRKWVTSEVIPAIRKAGHYEAAAIEIDTEDEVQSPDGLKLRKVNTASRIFGERAGAQLWSKLGLEIVPAMRPMLAQFDLLETVSITRRVGTLDGSAF